MKAAQADMLHIVRSRLCDELDDTDARVLGAELPQPLHEPLLWMLHGGPGTGKSEVPKMVKELFREVCGWQMGLEYQMLALQAVTAQLLDGDTIHHACGINPFGPRKGAKAEAQAAAAPASYRSGCYGVRGLEGAQSAAPIPRTGA